MLTLHFTLHALSVSLDATAAAIATALRSPASASASASAAAVTGILPSLSMAQLPGWTAPAAAGGASAAGAAGGGTLLPHPMLPNLKPGAIFTWEKYGVGKILGARNEQVWYQMQGGDSSSSNCEAWYWLREELDALLGTGIVTFDTESAAASTGAGGGADIRAETGVGVDVMAAEASVAAAGAGAGAGAGLSIALPPSLSPSASASASPSPSPSSSAASESSTSPTTRSQSQPLASPPHAQEPGQGQGRGQGQPSSRSRPRRAPRILSFAQFCALLYPNTPPPTASASSSASITINSNAKNSSRSTVAPWTPLEDSELCSAINVYADKEGVDPLRIYPERLEKHRIESILLPHRSSEQIQVRYSSLCVLNRAVAVVLPLVDVGVEDRRTLPLCTEWELSQQWGIGVQSMPRAGNMHAQGHGAPECGAPASNSMLGLFASSSRFLLDIKRVVFTRTKKLFWDRAVRETTTPTSAPVDEYERPDSLQEIDLNRIVVNSLKGQLSNTNAITSTSAGASASTSGGAGAAGATTGLPADTQKLGFQRRLQVSVFGQLHRHLQNWDERALRRSFVDQADAGQARAFFVRFIGEGVDDHGGPYRAALHAAAGEEPSDLLQLLVPVPNGSTEGGLNRDQLLFNVEYTSQADKRQLYATLGTLLGLSCRHDIQVPLALPAFHWRGLVGESVGQADIAAVDSHTSHHLSAFCTPAATSATSTSSPLSPATAATDSDSAFETRASPADVALMLQMLTALSAHAGAGARITPALAERFMEVVAAATGAGTATGTVAVSSSSDARVAEEEAAAAAAAAGRHRSLYRQVFEHLQLTSQQSGLSLLLRGLSSSVPVELFPIFTPQELEGLFCGAPDLDISVLRKASQYEGVGESDAHIDYFWKALEIFDRNERTKFINFCSGRSRLPASAAAYPMPFKLLSPNPRTLNDPDSYLPIAQTCFFSLSLPKYTSLDVMLAKLRYAVNNTELMDADVLLRRADGWAGAGTGAGTGAA